MTPQQQQAIAIAQAKRKRAEAEAGQGRSFGDAIYDNVVGNPNDGVTSYGESLGGLIRGAGAATARGLVDVPALPANLAQLGAAGVEKLFGMEDPSLVSRALNSLPDTRDMLGSLPVIGPESEFVAPGTLGEYVSTAGEFAGGAGGMSKIAKILAPSASIAAPSVGSSMLRYGVAPGVASEAAGQLTEGTAAEPYARAGAGVLAALAMSPKPGSFGGGGESAKMANRLQGEGVRGITVGQANGSQPLMKAEGMIQATQGQIDDFTAATMRQLGSTERLATPENLRAVEGQIVGQMDDAVLGVSIIPDAASASRAMSIADDYAGRAPQVSLTPRVRGIADEVEKLAASQTSVPLGKLKEWRSDIGSITTSNDAATREAAHSLRKLIDDMTDAALTSSGRTDDISKLASARESYRNYIAVRDAASRTGAEGGTLSPQALNQSVIRSQGREAYATGRTTPMAEFTRSGAAVLRPAPTVSPGGVRNIAGALPVATASLLGGGALQAGMSPVVAGLMAAGGAVAPEVGRAAMRSNIVQTLLRAPQRAVSQPFPVMPGIMSNMNEGR